MTIDTQRLIAVDRQTIIHPNSQLKLHAHGQSPARIMTDGKGVHVRDSLGNEYIDGFAGLYCVNIGYGRKEMAEAIYAQVDKLAFYHSYVGHATEPLIELSDRIIKMAGQNMSKVYYGLSGSDANDTQLKLIWYYNNVLGRDKKKKIISRDRAYHGSSVGSGSLTGLPSFHAQFSLPIEGIHHTVAPIYYRRPEDDMDEEAFSRYCAEQLEALIQREGPDTVAAFFGEPVLGTGGIVPPPKGYWREIRKVLDKYDILLVADEVVTAFGRLGHEFASQYYEMRPDMITIAKGLTSAYAPMSGVMVNDKVWQVLEEGADIFGPIGHGYTYSGHPLSAAAAIANLNIIERENLVQNAADVGAYFQMRLRESFGQHPLVGDVRGEGLLAAIEFSRNREKREHFDPVLKVGPMVAATCLEEGLIARAMPNGDILGFAPPLVLTREQVDEIVARVERAVNRVMDRLVSNGDWKPV